MISIGYNPYLDIIVRQYACYNKNMYMLPNTLGMHMEKTLWNQKLHTDVTKARTHYICT
jgi:hypothetical protein